MQQIGLRLRQRGMSHHVPDDVDLGERLRASIEAGDLPVIDLPEIQRRADRRARRRTAGTAMVAGASALAFVGALAVTVPAINEVTRGHSASSPSGPTADRSGEPGSDLADASLWPTLPPVKKGPALYLTPAVVASAVGSGTWYEPAADMFDPWTNRECSPSPLRDTTEAEAGLGPRPSSTHVEPWAEQPSQPAPAPAPGEPLPYDAFASLAVLRWDPATTGARDWQQTIEKGAAGCPDAVRVESGATIASLPVTVIAQPPTTDPDVVSDGLWNAMAVVAGGPTAVQVRYRGAPDAQAAGQAAVALLRDGVEAVAAGDRAARSLEDGARSGAVDDARLAPFTNPERWQGLPALHTTGAPPTVDLVTGEDLAAAVPDTDTWESGAIAGTGVDWMRSWCTPDQLVEIATPATGTREGGAPADELISTWTPHSGSTKGVRVDVDVLRWHPRDLGDEPAGGPAGVDDIALSTADAWGAAVAEDAATCPSALALDTTGLPGSHATLAAVDEAGLWQVQAVAVAGPTAVRIRATLADDDATAAGDQAVAIARRIIANTVRADDVALGRPDPGPLP